MPSIAFSHANGLYLPLNREDRQQLEPEVPTLTTEQVERLLFGKNDSTQAGPIAQDPSTKIESDETSVADVDLLGVFRNSKGPVTVVRNRKDGKLIVLHEAPTQEAES